MPRRFLLVTVCLVATVSFLVGLIVAGSMMPAPAQSAPTNSLTTVRSRLTASTGPIVGSFADIADTLNPAVVNIDASSRGVPRTKRRSEFQLPEAPDLFGRSPEREREGPRRGAGTGFIIDANGLILTNHHVIEDTDRIMVRLADGRTFKAKRVGSDPDTDIALIKVDSPRPLPHAVLGNSDSLRVGEWVMAIGNPLAYEHTVTVGVISFIGRKLFTSSLDRYIQTDAAINFGNSGGPLINTRGEVIGINAAISSRASNIGFAVPINQATAILPQLREKGRVSRGYIGVALRDVDADLQRSLNLSTSNGALVQDVTAGSPGARAGLRPYDLIVAVDGKPVARNDELIQTIASRAPGTMTALQVLRDGRSINVGVKLSERPPGRLPTQPSDVAVPSNQPGPALGMSVREIDPEFAQRFNLPKGLEGVIVSRVEPMSPAYDADIERGHVLLEINRQPVRSIDDYRRLTAHARPGEAMAFYVFKPEITRRELHTVKID
ncbi:MAG TPA: trypsin-like peptidase domain-containing protein [Vicinamibacterales bacterium]|nr:trypsin-like peptidase domain-containing protein [Vicinamibacterales bacterium]